MVDDAAVVLVRQAHSGVLVLALALMLEGQLGAVPLHQVHPEAVDLAVILVHGQLAHARKSIVHPAAVVLVRWAHSGVLVMALEGDSVPVPAVRLDQVQLIQLAMMDNGLH